MLGLAMFNSRGDGIDLSEVLRHLQFAVGDFCFCDIGE